MIVIFIVQEVDKLTREWEEVPEEIEIGKNSIKNPVMTMIFSNRFSQSIEADERIKNRVINSNKLNVDVNTHKTNKIQRASTEVNIGLPIGKEKNGIKSTNYGAT